MELNRKIRSQVIEIQGLNLDLEELRRVLKNTSKNPPESELFTDGEKINFINQGRKDM